MSVQRQMPRYKCHKEVYALRISACDGDTLCFVEEGYKPILVGSAWVKRHKPEVGGFYVVYRDGYSSYSPADAFLEGYTPLD